MIRTSALFIALTATGALSQPTLNLTLPELDLVGVWSCVSNGDGSYTDTIITYLADGSFNMQFDYSASSLRSGSFHVIGAAQGVYEFDSSDSISESRKSVQIERVWLEGQETEDSNLVKAFEASLIETYPSRSFFIQLSPNQLLRRNGPLARGLCDRTS